MNKKINKIKILLMMTMALSTFSLSTNAMENKQNATKPNILNKSFENKKPENNIFKNLDSNNKLKKSNSVENINNNLSLNENKQNATKPNILNKSFENKKPENNIFENLDSNNKLKKFNGVENINNNLSLNENKQKDNDILNKQVNEIIQDVKEFENIFLCLKKELTRDYSMAKKNYKKFVKLLEIIHKKIKSIIDDKENDKITNAITELKHFAIKENYDIYSIYKNIYKNPCNIDKKNIPINLNKEQIKLCEKIDKIEQMIQNTIDRINEIKSKKEKIEYIKIIKALPKDHEYFSNTNKEELKNMFKETIKNSTNQINCLEEEFHKTDKKDIETRHEIFTKQSILGKNIKILTFILKNNLLNDEEKNKLNAKSEKSLDEELKKLEEEFNNLRKKLPTLFKQRNILRPEENIFNNALTRELQFNKILKGPQKEIIAHDKYEVSEEELLEKCDDIMHEIKQIIRRYKPINLKINENDLEKLEKTQVKSNTQINILKQSKDISKESEITNNIINNMENELKPNQQKPLKPNQQEPLKIDETTIKEYQKILNKIKREIAMINDNTNKNNTLGQLEITKNVLNNNLKIRLNSLNETLNKKYGIENQIKNSIDMNSAYSDIENLTKKIDNLISNFKK